MTKDQLQAELKEKVKLGIKPSDLKKLKRSKSLGDMPSPLDKGSGTSFPPPPPLPNDPPNHLLQDQLTEKQKEIEQLRKDLETTSLALNQAHQDLDHSLAARIAGVKVFGAEHEKRKKVEQELNETIDEASEEIISSDNKVSSLRKQLQVAQAQITKLNQVLRLAPSHQSSPNLPRPESEELYPYLKLTLYLALTLLFILSLSNSSKKTS